MSKENVTFNDEEIELVQYLIKSYRHAYNVTEDWAFERYIVHEKNSVYAHLKRLERKMKRALEDSRTEFV